MAYNQELSSVKRIPRYNGDTSVISGLCDEVARQKLGGKLDVSAFQTFSSNAITALNGDYPVQCTDNFDSTYNISMDTLPLVPGNGIEFTEQLDSHGYTSAVAIECTGAGFPMTGTDGTTNYTANANFSSFTLTTGQGAAGAHVNMNVKGVHFEAYPATDVSASWYNIINKTNETAPTTYCYVYPSGYGELDLDTLTAYNKVTVFAPGDYSPDRMLYGTNDDLTHAQKTMPSGLWVEALKNRKEDGHYSWSLINSGWIGYNHMWEGD